MVAAALKERGVFRAVAIDSLSMSLRSRLVFLIAVLFSPVVFANAGEAVTSHFTRVLVLSKTTNWRHDSVPAGIAAFNHHAAVGGGSAANQST